MLNNLLLKDVCLAVSKTLRMVQDRLYHYYGLGENGPR